MIKALAKAIKKSLVCRYCGGRSPNCFGECMCSYNLNYFTAVDWRLVSHFLLKDKSMKKLEKQIKGNQLYISHGKVTHKIDAKCKVCDEAKKAFKPFREGYNMGYKQGKKDENKKIKKAIKPALDDFNKAGTVLIKNNCVASGNEMIENVGYIKSLFHKLSKRGEV